MLEESLYIHNIRDMKVNKFLNIYLCRSISYIGTDYSFLIIGVL